MGVRAGCREQHTRCVYSTASRQDRFTRKPQVDPDHTGRGIRAAGGGGRMKMRSIGFRLAAWYFLVLGCGLGAFSIMAWFAMQASIYHAIDDELRDRARGVTKFMDLQTASLSVPEIRDEFREHSVLGPGGDLFQVCDQTGQWLYRSVPLENSNIPISVPAALSAPIFRDMQ